MKFGLAAGSVIVSTMALIGIRQYLKKKGVTDADMLAGGLKLVNAIIDKKVFEQENRRNPLIAQSNQPYPVRELQPIANEMAKEMTEGIEHIDKKQRQGLCQKVTNQARKYLGSLWGVVRAVPGAFVRTADVAIGHRNQHGQLHSQKGLTANSLRQHQENEGNYNHSFSTNKQQSNNNNNNYISIISNMNSNNNHKGGSRTVHIKGVGKRVVRQTKTGRRYVLVNKKKSYLD